MKRIVFLLFCLTSLMGRGQNTPNIIFADNFETFTSGTIPFDTVMNRWQAVMPNYYAPNQSIISVDGHGQVWRSQYLENDCGAPRGIEIAALLDTVVEEIWVEVDAYHASGWYDDSSDGHYSGKMLAGGAYGGSHWLVVNNPYIVDTTGTIQSNGWTVHSGWGNGNPNRLFMYMYDQLSWNYQSNMGYVHPGEWHRYTTRIKMNTPGKKDGIAERYKDGVLVAQNKTMLFRSLAQYNAGICDIEGLVIKYAFGGSNDMCSDRLNVICFDNVVAYAYPPSSPYYLSGPAPSGHTIPQVSGTVAETIYPDPILYDETFTAPSATVRSHYTGGSFVPFSITKTYTKTITGQESPILMSFNRWHSGTNRADGYDCWVKIYSGTGAGKTLVKQYQESGEYDGVPVIGNGLIINNTSATIEYFTGRDRSMGWALEYSTGSVSVNYFKY